jgi:hypothetical protein
MKFLIDECLSLDLVEVAINSGFPESSHVVWMGKAGWKDWELKPFILNGDWTFVTRNSVDFRGPADNPGANGQYADVAVHPGLICINGPDGMTAEIQCELFQAALEAIVDPDHFVNEVIEVDLEDLDEDFTIRRYGLPVDPE